jgi:hypothetical protein
MDIEEPSGFWVAIKDERSASYAMKMAGLPAFLLGITYIGYAIFRTGDYDVWSGIGFCLGIVLTLAGLSIRSNKLTLFPYIVGITSIHTLLDSALMIAHRAQDFLFISGVRVVVVALLINGMRGWWWLRKNKELTSAPTAP